MFKLTKTVLVSIGSQSRRMFSSYETLSVTTPKPFVAQVELNRPDRLNALNFTLWE